jgi:mRNA-degrading endonuclease RelE of RelBE toxin-antitoxin system
MAEVVFRAEIIEEGELKVVPLAKLKQAIRRLRSDPLAGKPLIRELAGHRSIRLGGSENRLVYHYDAKPDRVTVIAIERRREGEVYGIAAGRT